MTMRSTAPPCPREIDWGMMPDAQAAAIFEVVSSVVYSQECPRPAWPSEPGQLLARSDQQRAIAASFSGISSPWRRDPLPKVLHTIGGVGLFRLDTKVGGTGSVLEPGSARLFVARYSRARGPEADEPHVASIAIKIPRMQMPSLDIMMLSTQVGASNIPHFKDMWKLDFATRFSDPSEQPGLTQRQHGQVVERIAALDAVAKALNGPPELKAYSLPMPTGIHCERLVWRHSQRAINLLRQCGDRPFQGDHVSPTTETPLSASMDGNVWAELHRERQSADGTMERTPIANVYLESRLHIGPIGDLWLQLTHPGVRP